MGEEDDAEIEEETALSRSAACGWALYGFTVQGEINQEQNLNRLADYIERLREYARFLRETLHTLGQANQSPL